LPGIAAGLFLSHFQSILFYSFDFLSLKTATWLWPGRPQLALPWVGSLVGAIIGGGLPLLVGLGYKTLRKRQGLGMGDVKMMAMVGAFLGYPLAILTLLLGSFFGSLVGILLMIFRHANLQTKLALGVFLGISTTISLFYGLPFLLWYWHIAR
jgi:leader peptidase (prepilin peptidase)/N-methyltransferase